VAVELVISKFPRKGWCDIMMALEEQQAGETRSSKATATIRAWWSEEQGSGQWVGVPLSCGSSKDTPQSCWRGVRCPGTMPRLVLLRHQLPANHNRALYFLGVQLDLGPRQMAPPPCSITTHDRPNHSLLRRQYQVIDFFWSIGILSGPILPFSTFVLPILFHKSAFQFTSIVKATG
jgi:hypothetical protein